MAKHKQYVVREPQVREVDFFFVARSDAFLFFMPPLQIAFQGKLQNCVEKQRKQWVTLLRSSFDRKCVALFVC